MRKEDLKDWTRDRLKDEIVNLSEKNFNLEWRIKQFEESEGRWKCENQSLKMENKKLEEELQSAKSFNQELDEARVRLAKERAALIDERNNLLENSRAYDFAKLQDQHQQDCIRINDLRTAYLITIDELAKLREQFGVGR